MEGYDRATYGDRFAPVYDDWYPAITDADACAAVVAEYADLARDAGGGPVLELGVGTGRLALPIAGLGLEVVGVDASSAMLERLAAKAAAAGLASVEPLLGDMACPPVGDRAFAVVLVAYNTLFNLVDVADQARCFASVAERLVPGGSLLVEAFVPDAHRPTATVVPRTITADRVVLAVSRSDPDAQEAMGQYVEITEAGIALRPWHIRWQTPEQLDAMAAQAGLELAERWSGWDRAPFASDAPSHVSRYVHAR